MESKFDIIFDLDGTLWDTSESYLYAYKKVIEKHPEIKPLYSDDEVLKTMGYTLDIVAEKLFTFVDDKVQIMKECLRYSCEYLLKNESTINQNLIDVVNKLKDTCRFFIVSNCPKEYFDVFFNKLGDNSLFTDYLYLTKSATKASNIKSLVDKYQITNCLVVGDSYIDKQAADVNGLLFAYYNKGYHEARDYDYLVETATDLLSIVRFNLRKQQILKTAPYQKTIHFRDAELTIFKNENWEECQYGFGFLRNTSYLAELLDEMIKILKQEKIEAIIGPIDYATWYQYRYQLDHFEYQFLPDISNTVQDVEILKQYGFEEKYHYSSTISTIDQKLWRLAATAPLKKAYRLEIYHDDTCYEHLEEIYDISVNCFKNALLYTPISYADFKALYVDNLKLINPDLVIIYSEDVPVAFSLSYPDVKNNIYVSKTVGIKKEHQNGTLILKLIDAAYRCMNDKKYEKVLFHFQNDEKPTLRKVYRHNVILQKHYAVFMKKI